MIGESQIDSSSRDVQAPWYSIALVSPVPSGRITGSMFASSSKGRPQSQTDATTASLTGALTVTEICAIPIMAEVGVIAGHSGLGRFVARLNVMTLPDVAEWTKPKELLLATGYPFPDSPDRISVLIEELNERDVSALAIKLDAYLEEIPHQALDVANRLGFPILILPHHVAIDDILSTVLSLIANSQALSLAHARDIHDTLLEASLRGSLEDILSSLSSGLGGAGLLISDHFGRVLAKHLTDENYDELRRRGVLRDDGRVSRLAAVAAGSITSGLVSRQLPSNDTSPGQLLAIRQDRAFDPHDEMIIEQAALIAAINISKSIAVDEVTNRFTVNTLQTLLTGSDSEVDDLIGGSALFGWDLHRSLRIMTCRSDSMDGTWIRERAVAEWKTVLKETDEKAVTGNFGNSLVAVCGSDIDIEHIALETIERISRYCELEISVGISEELNGPLDLRSGWSHAQTAAELALRLGEEPRVRRYETLGLLRLVDASSDKTEIDQFLWTTLGSILRLDEPEQQEMLATLRVLFKHGLNIAETARELHFHYNTVRYRVRKLENLIGGFTNNSRLALHVGVALEIIPLRTLNSR